MGEGSLVVTALNLLVVLLGGACCDDVIISMFYSLDFLDVEGDSGLLNVKLTLIRSSEVG